MAMTTKIDVKEKDLLGALRGFFKDILASEQIEAILVPQYLPVKNMVMPTLVTDPAHLDAVDPLAPAFPMNAAKIVSRLTRKPTGAKIAAVMRPCEIRAFVELVKLKQGRTDEVVLIGMDCLGAFQNKDYFRFIEQNKEDSTAKFYQHRASGNEGPIDGIDLAPACRACEYPVAAGADLIIGLYGMNVDDQILIQSQTEAGQKVLDQLNLSKIKAPGARQGAVDDMVKKRSAYRDEIFASTRSATGRSSSFCRALYTAPMPPRPSSSTISSCGNLSACTRCRPSPTCRRCSSCFGRCS